MKIFVYKWEYRDFVIYGCTPDGNIVVRNFVPYRWKASPLGTKVLKHLRGSKPIPVVKVPARHPQALLQFLARYDLPQCGWVDVPQLGVVQAKDIVRVNRQDIPNLHVISFDIETYSSTGGFPDPSRDEDVIICIGTVSNHHGPRSFIGEDLREFYQYLQTAHVVIGYNTHGFDWRYILTRYTAPVGTWVQHKWSSSACQLVDISYLSMPNILCLDLYHYCKRTFKIDDYRLNTVASYFGLDGKLDLKYDAIWRCYEAGDIATIVTYCERDCQLVLDIMERCEMLAGLFALAQVTHTPAEHLFTLGQQIRVKNMLYVECAKYGYLAEFKRGDSVPYEGAMVVDPVPGLYEHCACMDFASLYPSIIVSENICYSTYDSERHSFDQDKFGIIPNLITKLVQEREAVKHRSPAYANALKICANSIYGVFGASGDLNLTAAAAYVTRVGRESLHRAIEYLESKGFRVIYGDTDSCIYTKGQPLTEQEHRHLASEVTALFRNPMRMQYENSFRKFLVIGKKMYITLDDDKIRYKGVMAARRESCSFALELYREITMRVMKGIQFRDYTRERIRTIRTLPRSAFVLKKTYNGPYKLENYPLEVYNRRYGPLAPNETFFVIVSFGTTLGDRLRPADGDDPIDYQWYLKHLVNPIDAVMEAAGKVFRFANNIELVELHDA